MRSIGLQGQDEEEARAVEGPSFLRRLGNGAHALKVVPLVGLVAFLIHGRTHGTVTSTTDPDEALVQGLSIENLHASTDDVQWIDDAHALKDTVAGNTRAIVRATIGEESQHDIYLVRARRTPEGRVVSIEGVYPLTKTTDVDETKPFIDGSWIAFATVSLSTGVSTGVEMYDVAGEDERVMTDWKRLQRWQNAIANYQATGSIHGVKRKRYGLDPQASKLELRWEGSSGSTRMLVVQADNHHIVLDRDVDDPIEGKAFARFEKVVKGKPGDLITWTVDRVRAIPWLGPHAVETIEFYAFGARDWLKRKFPKVFAEDAATQAEQDLPADKFKPTYTDPEIGWPPAPLATLLSPPVANEGVWLGLNDDPFVGHNPGVPSAFVQTILRVDPERPYALMYITLWDPRQVSLHMVAGTVEPVSATGEVGTGQIPRTPEVLKQLVAGFDGGFQAVHFEGGMQVSGELYLPPKPYAGTVAEMVDGTTEIGSWPGNMPEVPDDILSFRQNLTPLVYHGVFNPYQQVKWGGTPPGQTDSIHTTRSGVCITKDGFVGYFFGFDMSHTMLGKGMIAAGCVNGVHLDMNAGHTGFEFYRVAPTGGLPDLGRALEGTWEAEGTVPQLDGWSFRARRMFKGMPHMLFPRYINRDGRDFMYLTLRSILPGDPIVPRVEPAEPKEGEWIVHGLPQHGFPYAIAVASVRPDRERPSVHARVLKVDPRAVQLEAKGTGSAELAGAPPKVLVFGGATEPEKGAPSLWLGPGSFAIGSSSPGPTAVEMFGGVEPTPATLSSATALIGVTDDDGTLILVFADAPDGAALQKLLTDLGCSQVMIAPKGLVARLGGTLDLSAELATTPLAGPTVALLRGEAPSAKELFPDTPVVDPAVWGPLQNKRVRYIGKRVVVEGKTKPAPIWWPGVTSATANGSSSAPPGAASSAPPSAPATATATATATASSASAPK